MAPTAPEPMPRGPADRSAESRSRLLGLKLRALVAEHLGEDVDATPTSFPGGGALTIGDAAWVIVDGPASRALGGALAWATRSGARSLDLVAERDTGLLARRAARFRFPIRVWYPVDRTSLPAVAEPLAAPVTADPDHLALRELIGEAGADPAVEHGVVFGEVRGLEVCRVVDEPTTGSFTESPDAVAATSAGSPPDVHAGVQLEVGVGAADREAFRLLHGHLPTAQDLAEVVRRVTEHRSPDAPQHPLNRLARERFLRWRAIREPSLVGARSLWPVEPPLPRPNLKDPVPCVAAGELVDGGGATFVFSSGVDLDLVPYLADVAATTDDGLVAALPRRDLMPLQRDLAALFDRHVEFVPVG
jgi:hypothetical protein